MYNTKKWDKSQEEFLIKNYGKMNAKEIGIIINKTPSSVIQRAQKLNINKINYKEWNDDDIQMLYDSYPSFNKTQLMNVFPNRKWNLIVSKANKLSIKRNNKHLEKIIGKTEKLLFDNVRLALKNEAIPVFQNRIVDPLFISVLYNSNPLYPSTCDV